MTLARKLAGPLGRARSMGHLIIHLLLLSSALACPKPRPMKVDAPVYWYEKALAPPGLEPGPLTTPPPTTLPSTTAPSTTSPSTASGSQGAQEIREFFVYRFPTIQRQLGGDEAAGQALRRQEIVSCMIPGPTEDDPPRGPYYYLRSSCDALDQRPVVLVAEEDMHLQYNSPDTECSDKQLRNSSVTE